ncbi:MAG: hypothetical protein SP1CHLAM54_10740 [Chlamydiia bacterium]|nr:hypothetical protein [Chlamydiia bacterium]MCH9615979.1 hypothetical protein [Chlamydiia bacterium]MCH9628618.1 hypothetical protein [Chlamydiia bacterium]
MSIKIRARFKPYFSEMGEPMLVPGTLNLAQVYPRCVMFEEGELPMGVKGEVKNFKVEADCERGWIRVSYLMGKEYISYRLKGDGVLPKERLSLGVHKNQDWRLIKRREDVCEILPLWLFMAPLTEDGEIGPMKGLLRVIEAMIHQRDRINIGSKFMHLFRSGFEGMLVPTTHDNGMGICDDVFEGIPWALLGHSRKLIRSLFIQEKKEHIELLPCLPVEAKAGRFVDVQVGDFFVDFEWRKSQIRRMQVRANRGGQIAFKFPGQPKTMRLHGKQVPCEEALYLEAGESLNLDLFR